MGGHPWFYVVDHQVDVEAALRQLREREFNAGRYSPAMMFPLFPIESTSPSPGPAHSSIDEAREAAAEEGTRSILDIERVSEEPDYCAAAPLDLELLKGIYGTDRPTLAMIGDEFEFLEAIEERGQGFYFTLYEDGQPRHLVFAGYSFD